MLGHFRYRNSKGINWNLWSAMRDESQGIFPNHMSVLGGKIVPSILKEEGW